MEEGDNLRFAISFTTLGTNISYPLTAAGTCCNQTVRNDSFLENFDYVLNE